MNSLSPEQISKQEILAHLNVDVRALNKKILDSLPGQCHEYFSVDEELDYGGNTVSDLQPEILNAINRSAGLPLHYLEMKENPVIMCLCNMTREVCNGTKVIVHTLHNHLLDCEILTGPHRREPLPNA
jgi:hypothetical protein